MKPQSVQRALSPRFSVSRALCLMGSCALLAGTAAAEFDVDLYADVLRDHTAETSRLAGTEVDYEAIAGDPRWPRLLAGLEAARPSAIRRPEERLAFWINAYNVLAIRMVIDHWPLESIRDAGSLIWPVWRREIARIEGERVTLHEIEHEILRPTGEPRIHGAIVCASLSCPSLAREPYRGDQISAQLDASMRRFLADPRKGLHIDRTERTVVLSRIFRWFSDDFDAAGGALAFSARYAPDADGAWIDTRLETLDLEYFEYDWALNAPPR